MIVLIVKLQHPSASLLNRRLLLQSSNAVAKLNEKVTDLHADMPRINYNRASSSSRIPTGAGFIISALKCKRVVAGRNFTADISVRGFARRYEYRPWIIAAAEGPN